MPHEKVPAARQNALLFTFGIYFYKVRRLPAAGLVFAVKADDPHCFSISGISKRVHFARSAEDEPSFARAIGQREWQDFQIGGGIQSATAAEIVASFAAGLISKHAALL